MKLIHKATGQEVKVGDLLTDFRGEQTVAKDWARPHSPASTGRLNGYYPSVFNCEWIDREDR